jgi:DNA-binding response OmpR family regulator
MRQIITNIAADDSEHEVLSFGDVHIDFTSMEGSRAGEPVTLTNQEFKLLRVFARSMGRVLSRDELLNKVWGYYPTTRTVDNQILKLRQKLEPDPARPQYFLTIRGVGYKFARSNPNTARILNFTTSDAAVTVANHSEMQVSHAGDIGSW